MSEMNIEILKGIRHHVAESTKIYEDFPNRITQLSTVALTISITFRSSFVSHSPLSPWLLSMSWGLFVISILSGLFVYWGKAILHIDIAKSLTNALKTGEKVAPFSNSEPRPYYQWAWKIMIFSFAIALIFLCSFAVRNN